MARRRRRNPGRKINWLLLGGVALGAYFLLKGRGLRGLGCCGNNMPMGTLYSEDSVNGPYGDASSGGDGLGVPGNILYQPVFPHATDEASSW